MAKLVLFPLLAYYENQVLPEYEVAEAGPEQQDDHHPPQRPRGHGPRALHRHPLREDARGGGHLVTRSV